MNPALYSRILESLLEVDASNEVFALVDAACISDEKLQACLASPDSKRASVRPAAPAAVKVEAPGAYLQSISVAGFRGVNDSTTLSIPTGPGLTLVIGRNGSGKSSFAEGIEALLIGTCRRWDPKNKFWRSGIRNVHISKEKPSVLAASFHVEGRGSVNMKREWPEGADVQSSKLHVSGGEWRELAWEAPLTSFRPFLSYAELTELVEEPSKLFDRIHEILGLHEVSAVSNRLAAVSKSFAAEAKNLKDTTAALQQKAASHTDERAKKCGELLSAKKKIDFEAIEEVLRSKDEEADPNRSRRDLNALAALSAAPLVEWSNCAERLRNAFTAKQEAAVESAEENAKLSTLLAHALPLVQQHPEHCPVCEQSIPDDFAATLAAKRETLDATSRRYREASTAWNDCIRDARNRVSQIQASNIVLASRFGFCSEEDASAVSALLANLPNDNDVAAWCTRLEELGLVAHDFFAEIQNKAKTELATLDAAFRPLALEIESWLLLAKKVQADAAAAKSLKEAEAFIKELSEKLRTERFEPIEAQVRDIWQKLGHQSSVTLDGISLEGQKTSRKLSLDVSIDGEKTSGLGVMSQGELNALSLSLFLPRMMLAESPFRFLIIDDPVQAMDPYKVDGLARVLQDASKHRQVVVFTHDPRLREALERMQIATTVVEVQRGAQSKVQCVESQEAASQYLKDAFYLAKQTEQNGSKLAWRVVPGFCRSALEAVCLAKIRRKHLSLGKPHEELEAYESEKNGTHELMAYALFEEQGRDRDLFNRIRNNFGHNGAAMLDAFKICKEGAHDGYKGDLIALVRATEALCDYVRGGSSRGAF